MKDMNWEPLESGDWILWQGEGENRQRLGAVVFQDLLSGRQWCAVSAFYEKGPEDVSGLAAGKRLVEQWAAGAKH